MTIYFSFMLTGITLIAIIGLRNELTMRIREKAHSLIFKHNMKNIDAWMAAAAQRFSIPSTEEMGKVLMLYPHQREPQYHHMLFDLTKWTFHDFYPELSPFLKLYEETPVP